MTMLQVRRRRGAAESPVTLDAAAAAVNQPSLDVSQLDIVALRRLQTTARAPQRISASAHRRSRHTKSIGDESVPKIIINDTIEFFS